MTRYLITRPEADAAPLADALRALGHDATLDPMLTIGYLDGVQLELDGVQAALITSANGVRAFAHVSLERRMPIYAVGEASAGVARQFGFRNVFAASGDVAALANFVAAELNPADGILLHVAGSVLAGDLKTVLAQRGFKVFAVRLYESVAAERLSAVTLAQMREGAIAGALLYSPRTAQILADLVIANRLSDACRNISALCLSQAVAEAAQRLPWRAIKVAAEPTQPAMLALVE